MATTKIEWTHHPRLARGRAWNPWWGCAKIAPECGRPGTGTPDGGGCYAATTAAVRSRSKLFKHFAGVASFEEGVGEWSGAIFRNSPAVWQAPFTWRKPALVFTCSMSDFWHPDVPLDMLAEALDVIDRTPHLRYLILTKRPGMIARRLAMLKREMPVNTWLGYTCGHPDSLPGLKPFLRVDAAVRFLSVEPLLAPFLPPLHGLSWLIGGGESGLRARPCAPAWARALRDHTTAAGVPFFWKQWGTLANNPTPPAEELDPDAKGGATLDGRLWREFPPL